MKMLSTKRWKNFINVSLHDSTSTKLGNNFISIYSLLSLLVKLSVFFFFFLLDDDKNTKTAKLLRTPFLSSSHGFNELLTSFTFVVIEHDNVAVKLGRGIRRKILVNVLLNYLRKSLY